MNKLMVRMNKKNKKGFTLVELIVVMAILAILAAILIPSVSGMIQRSNKAVDNASARNLYMAGTMYLASAKPDADGDLALADITEGNYKEDEDNTAVIDFIGDSWPQPKTNQWAFTISFTEDDKPQVLVTQADGYEYEPVSGEMIETPAG